jgi:hypothetical protein
MRKIKAKASETAKTTKTVLKNAGELLDSAALITVSLFSAHQAYYYYQLDSIHTKLLLAASLVIFQMGAAYAVRHLRKG